MLTAWAVPAVDISVTRQAGRKKKHSDLLFSNNHVVLDFSKDGWLDEVSFVCSRIPTTEQFCSFLFPSTDVSKDLLILILIYLKGHQNRDILVSSVPRRRQAFYGCIIYISLYTTVLQEKLTKIRIFLFYQ